jgi:cyclohexanecarboxylate-CoA ligase
MTEVTEERMSENRFDPAAHARSMRDGGFWIDRNFDEFLQQAVAATPGKLALLADRADRAEARRFTYAELGDLVARAAAALRRLGIGRGDVISVQLPNWWEFAVISLAAFRLGAIINPLMPIFREHELGYMLDFAETKLMIVPKLFRCNPSCRNSST